VSRSRIARLGAVALLALAATACMAIDTQTNKGYRGPLVYSGTRYDASQFADSFIDFNMGWMLFTLFDFPFSFLADTLMLPYTIPRESARGEKAAEEVQTVAERPSPVQPRAGEAPLATAQRLFVACEKLVRNHDPHLTDCYSIDAQIQIDGAAPLRGADYKPVLREGLARATAAYESHDWREPVYQVEGERVRISAVRGSSTDPARTPLVLVVGAGADGSWRILEEQSVGWPEPP
jgi:uncharacterized protein YceK